MTRAQEHRSIEWLNDTDWVYAPVQDRSRKTLQKILSTATRLFLANGYDETSLIEISKKSGISIGSIYHRFPDKQSILYAILESYRRTRFAEVDEMTKPELWKDKTALDVLRFHIEIIFSSARNDTNIMRLIERQRAVDHVVRDMKNEQEAAFCKTVTALYRTHAKSIKHPDVDKAVHYIHNIIRSSVLSSILSSPPGDSPLDIHNDEYQEEALKMAAAYLGIAP